MSSYTLDQALANLRSLGFSVGAKDLHRLHAPDPYEEELIVAAEVRAYFQVAYKVSCTSVRSAAMNVTFHWVCSV